MSHDLRRRLAAVSSLVVLLAACSVPGTAGDTDQASPSTSAPDGAAPVAAPAYTVPVACVPLRLSPGATFAGEVVATCWGDALLAHGSVRAWTNGPPAMEAEVVLVPSPRLRTEASDGRVVVLVDGASYSFSGGRWVAGVLNSEGEEEALVAATGEFAAVSFSSQGMGQGIAECGTWKVGPGRATVTLHDGSASSGLVRLDCTGPYVALGATTSSATLWVREDWTPVRHSSTLSVEGVTAESLRDFVDHGATFDIPTPAP